MRTRPLIVSHRGDSTGAPANTLDAFERAIQLGADMVEFDVRRTADGELVVFHDEDLDGRRLSTLSVDQVIQRDVPAGRRVPRLTDVLDACRRRIRLDVELKESGDEHRVLDLVMEHGFTADDFVVTAFDADVIRSIKRARPKVRAGMLVHEVTVQRAFEMLAEAGADFLGPDCRIVDEAMLRHAQAANVPLLPWTVNERRELHRLLIAPAVVGVITDRTEDALRIRESLESRTR